MNNFGNNAGNGNTSEKGPFSDNTDMKSPRRNLRGKALEKHKKLLKLSQHQIDAIVGTLLGDSTMGLRKGKPVYALKFEQSIKRKGYINSLNELFADFTGVYPSIRWIDKKAETRQAIGFRTYRHPSFEYYFNIFYDIVKKEDGSLSALKKVPQNIENFLNPRAIAYWFMDDGSYSFKEGEVVSYILNTQGFTKTDSERLCDVLSSKHNITSISVVKDGKSFRIQIWKDSVETFRNLIEPYIHPDFTYKIEGQNEKTS